MFCLIKNAEKDGLGIGGAIKMAYVKVPLICFDAAVSARIR
ncbi:hypothetical protein CBM2585_A10092 [Cupriavidus taiwanensis]|nr:hypothetical protein CBM2585_A10092 [Cupriavidus taiwanensis]